MRVLFVNNQFDNRGTGNALFDYARYNELYLNNDSLIMSLDQQPANPLMEQKLITWFGTNIHSPYEILSDQSLLNSIDVIYHIKSGENDGSLHVNGIPLAVHAVFNPTQPHGDRYATISRWMGEKFNVPYVPHVSNRLESHIGEDDLLVYRGMLGIPPNAIVFGRTGGPDTFDIPWVWEALQEAARRVNIYFLFMNTNRPDRDLGTKFIFLGETALEYDKQLFINTCDAMIHARSRGETYGMSVGEFAVHNKPVITYEYSPERAHIEMLGDSAVLYDSYGNLVYILENWDPHIIGGETEYHEHTPFNVMVKFKEVFL